MRILYVEENPPDADLMRRQMGRTAPDFQLETVGTIRDAEARLAKLDAKPLDLVLVDVRLPDGDGLSLLKEIRQRGLPVAVVVVTGTGDEEVAVAALRAGADDYLPKREDYLDRLWLTLESALESYRAEATRRARPLKVLYAEPDAEVIAETSRHFAEHAEPIHIDTVSSGPEVLARFQPDGPSQYDVILLDYRPPGLDALEVLKELRLVRRLDVPVVLLTEQGDEEVGVKAAKLGATGYVVKSQGYLNQLPGELEDAISRAESARREDLLLQSRERYKMATAAGGVGVWDWDLKSGNIYIDPMLKSILGYEDGEVRDHIEDWGRLGHPDDAELVRRAIQSHIAGETPFCEVEHRMIHKDGGVRWFHGRGTAVRDGAGKAIRLVGTETDITKRKMAEEALNESRQELSERYEELTLSREELSMRNEQLMTTHSALEEERYRYQQLFELAPDGYLVTDKEGVIHEANRAAGLMLGADIDYLVGKPVSVFIHQDDRPSFWTRLTALLARNIDPVHEWEMGIQRRNNSLLDVAVKVAVARDGTGQITSLRWLLRDITERKQAEEALFESEGRLQMAQRAARVGTWDWNISTGESNWSEGIYDLLGLEQGDGNVNVEDFIAFIHPEDRQRTLAKVEAVIKDGEEYYDEFRIIRRDGSILWLASKGRVVRDTTESAEWIIGVNIDITERKRAEEAKLASQARFAGIVDIADDAIISVDADQHITLFNKGAEKTFGFSAEEMMGQPLDVLLPVRFSELHRQHIVEFANSSDVSRRMGERTQIFGRRKDGSSFPAEASISKLDLAGEQTFTIILRDISERKKAEEALQETLDELQRLRDQLHAENIYLQEQIMVAHDFGEMVGCSNALKKVLRQAEQVAPLDTTVLIMGETGTGKELLAHALHDLSSRKARPLVKVNCATLPSHLIESELFGHEKGAFTGAVAKRMGRFEIANGGTIFLDEIGELPLDLQAKLLRVLQEGEFEHLGSSRTIKVDVRVIAATNRDLEEAVRKGLFRSDLYYRLSIFPITIPPLRERKDDIPLLVMHFVNQLRMKLGKDIEMISQETMEALQNYPWPGNIRELRNVIERAAIITQGTRLRLLDSLEARPVVEEAGLQHRGDGAHLDTLEESQRRLITQTLEKTYWRVEGPNGAAALLGIHPNTLRSRMKRLGIGKPKFKEMP